MYSRCFHRFPGPLAPSVQKWDRRDDQGASSEAINICRQLVSIIGTGIYHSMANVQYTVGQTVDPVKESTDQPSFSLMM